MPIVVDVDVMLARRKMAVGALADQVGITPANLSVLKNGRAKAVRFTTLSVLMFTTAGITFCTAMTAGSVPGSRDGTGVCAGRNEGIARAVPSSAAVTAESLLRRTFMRWKRLGTRQTVRRAGCSNFF